ncbi:hypothetical protein SBV1_690027 [Verrucomicrobia bacterium]|nr:hypothetical protein SBV1_690027 [Verrucomicrobiota bacterium]
MGQSKTRRRVIPLPARDSDGGHARPALPTSQARTQSRLKPPGAHLGRGQRKGRSTAK